MFIGRKKEMQFFNNRYQTDKAQLIVLYGRRRIGKTELLREFAKDKPHIFYSCREISDNEQLAGFSQRILESGNPAAKYITHFQDWESAFRGWLEAPDEGEKKLLIIDEFPYMCRGNASIPSILQVLWDELLKDKNIMLVLCGSAMSFMEKEVLSEKSPLYGRATGIYKMVELPFEDSIQFFPDYSPEDKFLAYAILGGIPHYLQQFDPKLTLKQNITRNILTKGCVLYSEVEFLIREELREPALYNTIIEAIALGNTKLNDIYLKTQIDKSKISVYLKNLVELRLIEREFSVFSKEKEKATSTRGLYKITDNFFRFWFRFVFTHLSDLEAGDVEGVYEFVVAPQLNDFASLVFETICRAYLQKRNQQNQLPFRLAEIGRWWGKIKLPELQKDGSTRFSTVDSEIDVVAVDTARQNIILGECKFRNELMGSTALTKLKAKRVLVPEQKNVWYLLFSKAGFKDSLKELAADNNQLTLVTLDEIVESWKR